MSTKKEQETDEACAIIGISLIEKTKYSLCTAKKVCCYN